MNAVDFTAEVRTDQLLYSSIDQLKSFCRGELSAVETYRQTLASTSQD